MNKLVKFLFIVSLTMNVGAISAFSGTWEKDNNGWRYKLENGNYAKNGWQQIKDNNENRWYYFNSSGYMYSNAVTPDGFIVAQSGEYIIPGKQYMNDVNKSEWEVKIYSQDCVNSYLDVENKLIDHGAYYELTNVNLSRDKHYYIGSNKKVGDTVILNGRNYRIKNKWESGYTVELIREGAYVYDSDAQWYSLNKEQDYYVLETDNDYRYQELIHTGSVYLSKDCIVNEFLIDKNHNMSREWIPITEHFNYVNKNGKSQFYPKNIFYGCFEMDKNGLITKMDFLYIV